MGRVFQHENGRRHNQNIANNNRHMENRPKEEKRDEPEVMDIAPGEPAPPGFEEMGRVSMIQVCIKRSVEYYKLFLIFSYGKDYDLN